MRYRALACDYDGTLAWEGRVSRETVKGLEGVRATGRKLVLVTGRIVDDLINIFPEIGLFDNVDAENGALLYRPASREDRLLAEPPPREFIDELMARVPQRVSVGRVILATRIPYETAAVPADT